MDSIEKFLNRIICGECIEVMSSIPDNSIDLICIDPPYLTTIEEWDKKEVVNELLSNELFRIAKEACSLYVWCGIGEKSQSLIRWFPIFSKEWYFKDLITWKKQRGIGMKRGWLYTREEIMWFVKNNKRFIWNKEEQYNLNSLRAFTLPHNKSRYNRYSNIWTDIKEINQAIAKNDEECLHPAQKPLKAIERIIKLHTKEGDIVLDCFIGSGTTAVACKNLNRNYIGIEINPDFCKIANDRLRKSQKTFF